MSASGRSRPSGRTRVPGRTLVLGLLLVLLLLSSIYPLRTYLAQRGRIAALEREARRLERLSGDLQVRIRQLKDPVYLERIARECLGMVRPGEISFVLVPKDGRSLPVPC